MTFHERADPRSSHSWQTKQLYAQQPLLFRNRCFISINLWLHSTTSVSYSPLVMSTACVWYETVPFKIVLRWTSTSIALAFRASSNVTHITQAFLKIQFLCFTTPYPKLAADEPHIYTISNNFQPHCSKLNRCAKPTPILQI